MARAAPRPALIAMARRAHGRGRSRRACRGGPARLAGPRRWRCTRRRPAGRRPLPLLFRSRPRPGDRQRQSPAAVRQSQRARLSRCDRRARQPDGPARTAASRSWILRAASAGWCGPTAVRCRSGSRCRRAACRAPALGAYLAGWRLARAGSRPDRRRLSRPTRCPCGARFWDPLATRGAQHAARAGLGAAAVGGAPGELRPRRRRLPAADRARRASPPAWSSRRCALLAAARRRRRVRPAAARDRARRPGAGAGFRAGRRIALGAAGSASSSPCRPDRPATLLPEIAGARGQPPIVNGHFRLPQPPCPAGRSCSGLIGGTASGCSCATSS